MTVNIYILTVPRRATRVAHQHMKAPVPSYTECTKAPAPSYAGCTRAQMPSYAGCTRAPAPTYTQLVDLLITVDSKTIFWEEKQIELKLLVSDEQ